MRADMERYLRPFQNAFQSPLKVAWDSIRIDLVVRGLLPLGWRSSGVYSIIGSGRPIQRGL